MEQEKTNKPQKTELQKQLGYFSVFKKLPIIVAAILFGLFIIWGIIDPCLFHYVRGYLSSYRYYGVMMLPNGFLCWLIWFVIGAIVSVCTYFSMKIAFSHKILQIYYLQKLANEETPILQDTL